MKPNEAHQPIFTIVKDQPHAGRYNIMRNGHFIQMSRSLAQAKFARLLWRVAFAEHYLDFKVSESFQTRLISMGLDLIHEEANEENKKWHNCK